MTEEVGRIQGTHTCHKNEDESLAWRNQEEIGRGLRGDKGVERSGVHTATVSYDFGYERVWMAVAILGTWSSETVQ